jgi:hypothetical protein
VFNVCFVFVCVCVCVCVCVFDGSGFDVRGGVGVVFI